MAAGAIPPPRFFEHRRASCADCLLPPHLEDATDQPSSVDQLVEHDPEKWIPVFRVRSCFKGARRAYLRMKQAASAKGI
jgi:hypothetical protein